MNDNLSKTLQELGNFKLNDINKQLRKIALEETAEYVMQNMLFKKPFSSILKIQKHLIDQVVLEDGLYLNLEYIKVLP